MSKKWRFRCLRTFFGLDDEYIENVYEQIFLLKHHSNWSFSEAYTLPIKLRLWFVQRLRKQFEDEAKEVERASSRSK